MHDHPTAPTQAPNDGPLIDMFCEWISDEAVRNRILADNAGRLYCFED
jgi:2-pyrone-4,6-dicarboxylate lactonase